METKASSKKDIKFEPIKTSNKPDESPEGSSNKRCSKKKVFFIVLGIVVLLSISLTVGLVLGLKKSDSHYKAPSNGTVFYGNYSSSTQQQWNDGKNRLLQDQSAEENSASLTFIVVNSTDNRIEMIVIQGIISEQEVRNLRNLDESESDDISQIPIFIVSADTKEGKILSMQSSIAADANITQGIISGVQMALVSSNGDDQARTIANEEICENIYGVLYCPTYNRKDEDSYYVLTAKYKNKPEKNYRMLEDSHDISRRSQVEVEKSSYIDGSSGSVTYTAASGQAKIPSVSNDTNSEYMTMTQNVTANFTYSSDKLTIDECVDLKNYVTSKVEFVETNLTPNSSATSNSSTNGTVSNSNGGRNLEVIAENNIKLVEILGMPIYLNTILEETPSSSFKATTHIKFSGILSVELGSKEFGNGIVKKLKKFFTLKNTFENSIREIQDLVSNFANAEVQKFNDLVLVRLAQLQSLISSSGVDLTNFMNGLLGKAQNYTQNVEQRTVEYKEKYEDQVMEYQVKMQNYLNDTIEPLKNNLNSVKQLKDTYESELKENIEKLNDLKDNTLKGLLNEKDLLINEIYAELEKFNLYKTIQSSYAEIKTSLVDYAEDQIQDLEYVKATAKNFVTLSSDIGEDLKTLGNYASQELLEFKSSIDAKVTEINQNVKDIETQIYNEVTLVIDQINAEIADLNTKIAELEEKIKLAIGAQKDQLVSEKNELVAQVKEKSDKLSGEIAQKKSLLENQKNLLLNNLNSEIEKARNEYFTQLGKYKTQAENIQQILSNELTNSLKAVQLTINQAKSSLTTQLNDLKGTITDEVTEKREVLDGTIKSVEDQLKLELSNLESLDRLNAEINNAIDFGKSEIQYLDENLKKTKEEISKEIESIKTEFKNKINDLDNQLQNQIYNVRSEINNQLATYQLQYNDLKTQLENASADAVEEIQNKIDVIDNQIKQLNENLASLESLEIQLLSEKQKYENKLSEIIEEYSYELSLKVKNFKEFFETQQSKVNSVVLKMLSLNETLEFCAESLKNASEQGLKNYADEIVPFTQSIDSAIKKLNNTEQSLLISINLVEVQINDLSYKNETLLFNISQSSINITALQDLLDESSEFYNSLSSNYTMLKSSLDMMLNGTYDWNEFFRDNNLFSIRDEIEAEINLLFDTLSTKISDIQNTVEKEINNFLSISNMLTASTKDKSSEILSSGQNIEGLPESSDLNSTTDIFDFKYFTDTVDRIKNIFNSQKTLLDSLINTVSTNILDDISDLNEIVSVSYWETNLNSFISKFEEIEKKFGIKLSISIFKETILNRLNTSYKVKIEGIFNTLSIKDKLLSMLNDFATNTLNSLVSSSALTKTFIKFLDEFIQARINLMKYSMSYRLNIGSIPTPIGIIVVELNANVKTSLDLASTVSATKLSTSLIPSGNLELTAAAVWNFVVGKVGCGASLWTNAELPIEFGIKFSTPKFYYLITLDLSIVGKVGLFYQVITVSAHRICIGRRWWRFCFNIYTWSYTSPRYFVDLAWNYKQITEIIPLKEIGF